MKQFIIYKITNKLNGDCYIGQTKRSLQIRWKEHSNLRIKACRMLKEAIAVYGRDNFTIFELNSYSTITAADTAEQYFIQFYNSLYPNGYNLNSGGRGYEVTEETRRRLSVSHLGQKPSAYNIQQSKLANIGRPTWNKGMVGYTNKGSFKKGEWKGNGFKLGHPSPNKGKKRVTDSNGKTRYI